MKVVEGNFNDKAKERTIVTAGELLGHITELVATYENEGEPVEVALVVNTPTGEAYIASNSTALEATHTLFSFAASNTLNTLFQGASDESVH